LNADDRQPSLPHLSVDDVCGLFHVTVDRLPCVFFVISVPEYEYTYLNDSAIEWLSDEGLTPEEVLGAHPWDIFPKWKETLFSIYEEARRSGQGQKVRGFKQEGLHGISYWDLGILPTTNAQNQVASISTIGIDVTDTKLEEDLNNALTHIVISINSTLDIGEIMKRAIEEASNTIGVESAVITLYEDGYWVPRYVHGTSDVVIGRKLPYDQLPLAVRAAETRKPVIVEDISKEGPFLSELAIQLNARSALILPLYIRNHVIGVMGFHSKARYTVFGKIVIAFAQRLAASLALALENARLFGELMDELMERSALQDEIKNSERRLYEILESIQDAFFALDKDWKFVYVNNQAEEVWHKHREEIIGKNLVEVFPQAAESLPLSALERAMHERRTVHMEAVSTITNSWIDIHAYPTADGGLTVYFSDISERKQAEQELSRTRDELQYQVHLLQRALFPPDVPDVEGFDVAWAYIPAYASLEIGGDFYDVFVTANGKLAVLIGDVSGKGIEAAAMASITRSTVHAFAYDASSPAEALKHANAVLSRPQIAFSQFITAFLLIIDNQEGKITYSSAGHPPALIRRADNTLDELSIVNIPLGIKEIAEFEQGESTFGPGDKVVLYTDGVTEARSDLGMFKISGVGQVLTSRGDGNSDEVVAEILSSASTWAHGVLKDDTAVVVIEQTTCPHVDTIANTNNGNS